MSTPKPIAVVKIGGALVSDPSAQNAFWSGIKHLVREVSIVVVHGGGPQSTAMARRLGHTPRMVEGRRVTTDVDLDILHWTLRGALNTQLVSAALKHGLQSVGLSGADGATIQVEKRPPWTIKGEIVDFGWVGDIEQVNPRLIHTLLDSGYLPIISPMGIDGAGQTYNVNADTIACALAQALKAEKFLLVTESGGVRKEAKDPDSHLNELSKATFQAGRQEGWIVDGMVVKLNVGFNALDTGIAEVYILSPSQLEHPEAGTQLLI